MAQISAGLLMCRQRGATVEVLLVHPGGRFWRNKDQGVWSIPKGEVGEGEELLAAAQREFEEETGYKPKGRFIALKPIKQKSGKVVHAWAFEGDVDPSAIKSNLFTMEWPPKSGKFAEFPEVNRAEFFDLETAKKKINPEQVQFVAQFASLVFG